MKVRNRTSFKFAPVMGQVNYPAQSITCVVKASFVLAPGGAVLPLETQCEIEGDVLDKSSGALLYEADLVPFKPVADILFRGSCHTPQGKPLSMCPVKLTVGEWSKELAVIGNRVWNKGLVFSRQSEPEQFTTCALHWGNAFGGKGYADNPVGKGFKDQLLPNIEYPGGLIKAPGDKPQPAGFGPQSRTLKRRVAKLGTYDKKWLKERWPALPADVDWTYFNAAPDDQQLPGFLRGDETIELLNMHASHSNLRCSLPGIRVRCVLRRRVNKALQFHDVPMNLDTLFIDGESGVICLLWRGVQDTHEPEFEDVHDVLIFSEPLHGPATSHEQYTPWFEDPAEEAKPELPPPPPEPAPGEMTQSAVMALVEKAQKDAMGQLSAAMKNSRGIVAPPVPAPAGASMASLMAAMKSHLGVTGQKLPTSADQFLSQLSSNPEMKKLESEAMQAQKAAKPPAPPGAAKLALSIKSGIAGTKDFSGQDLSGQDLGGSDLTGADFRNAILVESNLSGCKLDGTIFVSAVVTGAKFVGSKGAGALFSHVLADGADFEKAELPGADFNGAELRSANFKAAKCAGARFSSTQCQGLRGTEADFTEADFSMASLDGADFTAAKLAGASLWQARGAGVVLKAAKAPGLRASEAVLSGLDAEEAELKGSLWQQAQLENANFRFANLAEVQFADTRMPGCILFGAVVRRGFLRKADLSSAQAGNADFFQANFERANLSKASLVTSNCFQAAFYQAVTDGADFEQANVARTLLAR